MLMRCRPAGQFLSFCVVLVLAVPSLLAGAPSFSGPAPAGKLAAPARNEASGLAASRHASDLLWINDDSGAAPVLYGVSTTGELRGTLRVSGVRNDDWEDLASCELDGKPWLLVADTGDNDAKRKVVMVHLVPEPDPARLTPRHDEPVAPAATFRITYEDGSRDCESIAIDPKERAVYLLTKREKVPRLYRFALPTTLQSAEVTARFVGLVPHIPQPTTAQRLFKGHLGQQRARPCGMDFLPDGSAAVVVTYGDLLVFHRQGTEPWATTLAREPVVLTPHNFVQAEGVCFSRDGKSIYVASEQTRTLLRYDR